MTQFQDQILSAAVNDNRVCGHASTCGHAPTSPTSCRSTSKYILYFFFHTDLLSKNEILYSYT